MFSGTAIAATVKRQPHGGERVLLGDGGEKRPGAVAQRLGKHGDQRRQQEERDVGDAGERQQDAHRCAVFRRVAEAGRGRRAHRARAQACSMLIASSSRNEIASIAEPTAAAPA